jgi:ATP-binding cassette subfamily F protein uup
VVEREARDKPAAARAGAARPAARQKLSFKHKHALDTLPGVMDRLSAEIAALSKRLEDPGLYARDAGTFAATTARLEAARAELGRAEDEWLELELLREELGA